MKSLSLGELFGIRLELHWTFLLAGILVLSFVALSQPANMVPILMVFFFLFLSVFLHELAHSVVSLQRGIRVEKITLLPIGGVSLTESLPEKPKDEFLIAIAGPALNFAVVAAILLLVSFFPLPFPRSLVREFPMVFSSAKNVIPPLLSMPLFTILWWNLILGSFNLFLPALPLDGGRVFRSLLSLWLGRVKATLIATRVATVIAVGMFLLYFVSFNIFLPVIAFFVFFGSREEEKVVLMKEALKGKSLSGLINKKPLVLKGSLRAGEAFKKMLAGKKGLALVELKKGKYAVLSVEDAPAYSEKREVQLSKALKEAKPIAPNAEPGLALDRMLSSGRRLLPVVSGKKLLGAIEARELEKAVIFARSGLLLKKQHFKKTKKG